MITQSFHAPHRGQWRWWWWWRWWWCRWGWGWRGWWWWWSSSSSYGTGVSLRTSPSATSRPRGARRGLALGRHQLLALGSGAQRAQRLLRGCLLLLQRLELGAQRLTHHLEPALLPLDGRGETARDRAGLGRRCGRAAAELRAQCRRRRPLALQLMQQLLLARRARRHSRGQLR